MREILGIDKALQSTQGELLNNNSKLTKINKSIKRDTKKLEEVENAPTYSDEQRQLYRDRLDDLNTEKQARLEILSQNRKDLQTQVARIRQTIEKVLDKDKVLAKESVPYFVSKVLPYFESAELRALRASCPMCSCALPASCPTCSRALYVSCPTCSRALCGSCPTCLRALRASCPAYLCALHASCPTCSRALRACVPYVRCVLRAYVPYVITCPTSLLHYRLSCLMCFVVHVLLAFSALYT